MPGQAFDTRSSRIRDPRDDGMTAILRSWPPIEGPRPPLLSRPWAGRERLRGRQSGSTCSGPWLPGWRGRSALPSRGPLWSSPSAKSLCNAHDHLCRVLIDRATAYSEDGPRWLYAPQPLLDPAVTTKDVSHMDARPVHIDGQAVAGDREIGDREQSPGSASWGSESHWTRNQA